MTEHDGKHHGRRPSRPRRQVSRAEPGETATPSTILPRRPDAGAIPRDLVASAQRTVGNAAVQRLLRRRTVQVEAIDPSPTGVIDRKLPQTQGDYAFFEERTGGVRFLVGVPTTKESAVRKELAALANRIAADNALIADPKFRIATCFLTDTGSRLALWKGDPVLMIDHNDPAAETVAHEMGHAFFFALEHRATSKEADAKQAGNFRASVADIFVRLSATKDVTVKVHVKDAGKVVVKELSEPAGLWIVDPSQWKGGKAVVEHPWDDPDEFFGSAKEAYQIDRKGLEKAIERFKKQDPAVEQPMTELLALLDALFGKSQLPASAPTGDRAAAAAQALKSVRSPSNAEDATSAGVQILIANA